MSSEILEELRSTVRSCVDRSDGPRPFLVGEPDTTEPFDAELWKVLGTDVGVAGLLVPEELGGAGAGMAEVAVVAEELGRSLSPLPFLATVGLATGALLGLVDDPVARDLLTDIASGSVVATLADPGGTGGVRAEPDGSGWVLTGGLDLVVDGAHADVLLVPAATAGLGVGLFAVDAGSAGLAARACRTLDLTRPLGAVSLSRTPACRVGPASDAAARLAVARDLALVVQAVEQVGGAQRCLDAAVAYARARVQFDQPIGSFQAVQHTLVDVLLDVETARSAAEVAVAAADRHLVAGDAGTARALALHASLAAATCAEAYLHTAEETLHVHGGIGFTWEHDAHLHYRRAKAGELLFGTPHAHRARLATMADL